MFDPYDFRLDGSELAAIIGCDELNSEWAKQNRGGFKSVRDRCTAGENMSFNEVFSIVLLSQLRVRFGDNVDFEFLITRMVAQANNHIEKVKGTRVELDEFLLEFDKFLREFFLDINLGTFYDEMYFHCFSSLFRAAGDAALSKTTTSY